MAKTMDYDGCKSLPLCLQDCLNKHQVIIIYNLIYIIVYMLSGLWEVLLRGENTTSDIYFKNQNETKYSKQNLALHTNVI